MFGSIKGAFESLLGGSEGDHPLDRPKEDHQIKRQEAEEKLGDLRSRRSRLKSELEAKRADYEAEKEAGNDEQANDLLRDAEAIKKKLETVRGRIDEVTQQRNFAANMINSYEMRASQNDDYWRQLKEMDQKTLFREFSRQELEIEEMLDMLEKGTETSGEMISSYREQTEDMHRASDLEEEWSDDTAQRKVSPDDVFETDEPVGEVNTERSDEDIEMS